MQSVSAGPSATCMAGAPGIVVTGPAGVTGGRSSSDANGPMAALLGVKNSETKPASVHTTESGASPIRTTPRPGIATDRTAPVPVATAYVRLPSPTATVRTVRRRPSPSTTVTAVTDPSTTP